ncbi:MAG TPA: hypothetical protein VFG21_08685 [Xanthomonadaceae bacterium]|nr:hypothetical protein [Xanthomonadaceae bacterium]
MLWAAPTHAQLIEFGPQLSAAPASGTAGGTIGVGGDRLREGANYQVDLVAGRARYTLATVAAGDGQFYRVVTLPVLDDGNYTMELLVDGALVDSIGFRVLAPLSITFSNTKPTAGSTIGFTVSGLAEGSLQLVYAGKPVFGPVSVSGGSHSGKFQLPTDRPSPLPATVAVAANNAVGKLVPRIGSSSLYVGAPDTNPFARLIGSSSTTTSPQPRLRFGVSGGVATNEIEAEMVEVEYFWQAADGSVQPMGAIAGMVLADGSFDHTMRTPQIGTMGAGTASGTGRLMTVTRTTDRFGVVQQQSTVGNSMSVGFDTDAAIDLNITLVGSDGLAIEGARIDLVDADLDDLYNDNSGGVSLDGAQRAGLVNQYPASDEVLGCPANLERQYTDAQGKAEFQFDLDIPGGGVNIDGSGPAPRLTIDPSEQCIGGPDINTPGYCTVVDPAGVQFSAIVRAAFLGYGYIQTTELANGTSRTTEREVRLNARIDRYTGEFELETCIPGQACTSQTYQSSANKQLVLPKLNVQGLLLGDPYFVSGFGHKLALESDFGTSPVVYEPVMDLSPFRATATFIPATPETWAVEFAFDPGAGRGLEWARLQLFGHGDQIPFVKKSGAGDCDSGSNEEIWRAELPTDLALGFRFPRDVFGDNQVDGAILAKDLDDRNGWRVLRLQFEDLDEDFDPLVGNAGVVIETVKPHARRLSVIPALEAASTDAPAKPSYGLEGTDNSVTGANTYELCIPADANCAAYSAVEFAHQQFSRSPSNQPPGAGGGGASGFSEGTGTEDDPWVTLFEKTIPLFRWYWGVPELLSAEVFADLVIRAEYMMRAILDPANPSEAEASAGGLLAIGIMIGVDIDVLFGILVDAGAAIYGEVTGAVVTTAGVSSGVEVDECLRFIMDFNGWLEIGCPVPNPFDPTCYIPDIEETFNIINEHEGSCSTLTAKAGGALATLGSGWPLSGPKATEEPAPPVAPLPAGLRESITRHPALAIDGSGNRLVLNLDKNGHLVSRSGLLRGFGTPVVISQGYGIRDTAVSFFGTNMAVAVWSESSLAEDARLRSPREAARYQFLRYAIWDGSAWTRPADLTQPGFGEGHVRLARCSGIFRSDCFTRKVTMVFQRNIDRTIEGRKGIFTANFNGSTWGAVTRVDQSGDYNITPAIAYQGGQPVIAWVRYAPTFGLSDIDKRRLALRRLDGSAEVLDLGLPARIAQPTLATVDSGKLAIAFTRAATGDAFIGTRQAIHMGVRNCQSGCRFSSWQAKDEHGRAVYGERPVLVVNGQGEPVVTFRGLALGAIPGVADPEDNILPTDPVGIRAGTGELLQLRSPLANVRSQLLALSNDGGWHAQPSAALDPSTGEIVAISLTVDQSTLFAGKLGGHKGAKAMGASKALDDGLAFTSIADLPDLAIETLSTTALQLDAGTSIPVTVAIANRGSAWVVDDTHSAQVRVWWETPQTRTTLAAEFAVDSLGAGGRVSVPLQVPVPAAFGSDERQTLRAEIVLDSSEGEIDGGNNGAGLAIGGMPVPLDLLAVSEPGTRFVNLLWTAPADPRIAGYRVYLVDGNGVPQPVGSSFNLGFADISAQYGQSRTYRVSSYSARGIESELTDPVTAQPSPKLLAVSIFSDGLEAQ